MSDLRRGARRAGTRDDRILGTRCGEPYRGQYDSNESNLRSLGEFFAYIDYVFAMIAIHVVWASAWGFKSNDNVV